MFVSVDLIGEKNQVILEWKLSSVIHCVRLTIMTDPCR